MYNQKEQEIIEVADSMAANLACMKNVQEYEAFIQCREHLKELVRKALEPEGDTP